MTNTPKLTRSQQARINGAKSKGPNTPEGKAISSRNAMRHGFAAVINNVLSVEDEAVFERHVAGYRAALAPLNYLEETLIDQLASINWRQSRLVGIETALIDAQLSFQKDAVNEAQPLAAPDAYARLLFGWHALARKSQTPADPAAIADSFDVNCLELVRRYITTLDRQYRNTLLNLRQYRKDFASPQLVQEPNEPDNIPPPSSSTIPEAHAEAEAKDETQTKGANQEHPRRDRIFPISSAKPTLIPSKEPLTTQTSSSRDGKHHSS